MKAEKYTITITGDGGTDAETVLELIKEELGKDAEIQVWNEERKELAKSF